MAEEYLEFIAEERITNFRDRKRPSISEKNDSEHSKKIKNCGVPVSSLLSTSAPWLEDCANSFIEPYFDTKEQRAAYWRHYASFAPIIQLHEEIIAFEKYISPTPAESRQRAEVVERVSAVVCEIWPGAKVSYFGSFFTQLYLPTSDIDMVVIGAMGRTALRKLATTLLKRQVADAKSIKIISKARKISSITVDISFNQDSGVIGSEKLRALLLKWPGIKPLVLVLKQFLLNRGLNEVYTGGLGSYGLILLCVSFFQMHPMIQTQMIRPDQNLGVLLIEFFELYGKGFAYDRVGISVLGKGSYFAKGDRFHSTIQNLLCIEDPYDPDNDVTKSSFSINLVRQSFAYAFEVLTSLVEERTERPLPSSNTKGMLPPSLLSSIIRIPKSVIARRFQAQNNQGGRTTK